jgi:hypothetical protein
MPRQKNRLPTWELTISSNPVIQGYLQELVDTGMYGNNEAEAAERLLVRAIDILVESGKIQPRPKWETPRE